MGLFNRNPTFYTAYAYLLLVSLAVGTAIDNEVEDEHPFNYEGGHAKGPTNWGKLDPKWKACGSGKLQSPIDLVDGRVSVVPAAGGLKRTYRPSPAILRNRGHDISVVWSGNPGGVVINNTEYKLVQGHWHTPSEHTINGTSLDMELHLVHNNTKGDIAVVGILYKLGRRDSFLEKLMKNMKSVTEEGVSLGVVDPCRIKFGGKSLFRYMGSLTVPPCSEGVLWTILHKVRTVSADQIAALREAVHDGFQKNARPIQKGDGRKV